MKVLLLLMLPFVNGFLSGSPKLIKTSRDAAVNINPTQHANTISRKSFSELIKDVDNKNVDALFFTNDMKTVYSREDLNTDGIYDIEDYSITTVDPSVSTMIFEHSNKQDIKTTILKPQSTQLTHSLMDSTDYLMLYSFPRLLYYLSVPFFLVVL